jgi:hypothetical protein
MPKKSLMPAKDPYFMSTEELQDHKKFMEEVRTAEPARSCEMIRAWTMLNIEATMTDVQKN